MIFMMNFFVQRSEQSLQKSMFENRIRKRCFRVADEMRKERTRKVRNPHITTQTFYSTYTSLQKQQKFLFVPTDSLRLCELRKKIEVKQS